LESKDEEDRRTKHKSVPPFSREFNINSPIYQKMP